MMPPRTFPAYSRARERQRDAGDRKRVRGGFRDGEAAERRAYKEAEQGWADHGPALVPAIEAVEVAAGMAWPWAEPEEVDLCAWCDEPWTVDDMHDIAPLWVETAVLVCVVCDPSY